MSSQWDLVRRPSWQVVLDCRCWATGVVWYDDMIGLDLGPLGFKWYPADDRFKRFCRSWKLFERRIGRINLHLGVDTYTWRIGYIAAAPWDHGVYLGPANLQVEYDLVNDEDA